MKTVAEILVIVWTTLQIADMLRKWRQPPDRDD